MRTALKHKVLLLLYVGICCMSFAAGGVAKDVQREARVAMVFPVTVDAFLSFQNEAEAILKQRGADVRFYSAEGDPSRFQTIIDAALLKHPDVMVFVGTQLTNVGLSPRYLEVLPKAVASAISDPAKVEQLTAIGLEPDRKRAVAILTDMPKENSYISSAQNIRKLLPSVRSVGVLYNDSEINSKNTANQLMKALEAVDVTSVRGVVTSAEDVAKVTRTLVLRGVDLLVIPHDKYVINKAATVVKIGKEAPNGPIPVFSLDNGTVRKDGAAFGVSVDYGVVGKMTGQAVLNILDGQRPEQMQIVRQERANTYINLETWKALGLPSIPDDIKQSAIFY